MPHRARAAARRGRAAARDGTTFAENALGKARAAARATGAPAIADDSGIEAAALGGAPGRPLGALRRRGRHDGDNLAKLLREAPAGSALAYVCALAYVDPARRGARLRGPLHGHAGGRAARRAAASATTRRSCPTTAADGRTMAELATAEKDAISHRGRAARELLAWLAQR